MIGQRPETHRSKRLCVKVVSIHPERGLTGYISFLLSPLSSDLKPLYTQPLSERNILWHFMLKLHSTNFVRTSRSVYAVTSYLHTTQPSVSVALRMCGSHSLRRKNCSTWYGCVPNGTILCSSLAMARMCCMPMRGSEALWHVSPSMDIASKMMVKIPPS